MAEISVPMDTVYITPGAGRCDLVTDFGEYQAFELYEVWLFEEMKAVLDERVWW